MKEQKVESLQNQTNIYHSIEEFQNRCSGKSFVATLGLFDGVHLGHRHLIASMCEMAKEFEAESLVITLDRHPLVVLRPDAQPPLKLTTLKDRIRYLADTGVDHVLVLPFGKETSLLSAREFVAPVMKLGLKGMMLGYDNRFGKKNEGETLESFDRELEELGLKIRRVATLEYGGLPVSSSRIRHCLAQKNFAQLEELLGRPYSLTGRVQGGRQIGRTIEYPTANIAPEDPQVVLPESGVYISEVVLDGVVYMGMSYYGSTPTITSDGVIRQTVEVFLFDFHGDLYGKELEISFREFIRPDEKFPSLEALRLQLRKDEERSREFFRSHPIGLKVNR